MNDNKFGRVEGIPEDEPLFILRGKDMETPNAIRQYALFCRIAGSPPEHIEAVERQATRIVQWQNENPARCKVPD